MHAPLGVANIICCRLDGAPCMHRHERVNNPGARLTATFGTAAAPLALLLGASVAQAQRA